MFQKLIAAAGSELWMPKIMAIIIVIVFAARAFRPKGAPGVRRALCHTLGLRRMIGKLAGPLRAANIAAQVRQLATRLLVLRSCAAACGQPNGE
jgi:hypothetical protein